MKLHVFNPEHDLALAAHKPYFTAPAAGRKLRRDLAFLPALWASSDDLVLVDDIGQARRCIDQLGLPVSARLTDRTALRTLLREQLCVEPLPWGWDLTVRQELADLGIDPAHLPDHRALEEIRQLSHRAWSATHLLPNLIPTAQTIGMSWVVTSTEEVRRLTTLHGPLVVKAPWSSSGRGIRYLLADTDSHNVSIDRYQANWMANVIRHQGALIAEPLYDKLLDFAMEFETDGKGTVTYLGLSLFATTHGAYTGNVLATEKDKLCQIANYIPERVVHTVRQQVIDLLSTLFNGHYRGPFGIDMMVVRHQGTPLLHPCVELNLRHTMGHAALAVTKAVPTLPATMGIAYDGGYKLVVE